MPTLPPFQTLLDLPRQNSSPLPLPPELTTLYGPLSFPQTLGSPHILANFVTTLDGVTSLQIPGQSGGGPISGNSPHDHALMGLLRATADAIIVGAGTLRSTPQHLWTPAYIYPPLASAYQSLRAALHKPNPPLTVIITARGDIDPTLPVLQSNDAPVLVITTPDGARHLKTLALPSAIQIAEAPNTEKLPARSILTTLTGIHPCDRILVEGGPHLLGDFYADHALHEQFLTLSPQLAGRDSSTIRPALIAGHTFAPTHPLWGTLLSIKRAQNHLFLRYSFTATT